MASFPFWIVLNLAAIRIRAEFKFKERTIHISLAASVSLASLLLFGLFFTIAVNLVAQFVNYILTHRPLYRWGITASIHTVTLTAAMLLLHFSRLNPAVSNASQLFFSCFLLQLCLTLSGSFLFDVCQSLETNTPLKGLLYAELHEFLLADLLEIFLYPMLAVILITLWLAGAWAIPILGIPFYGLKLVMDNTHEILKELENGIHALNNILEAKDDYTEHHTERVSRYAAIIAKYCGLSEPVIERISKVGRIHDIGKILVNDDVLKKPGRLNKEEYEHIKLHVQHDFVTTLIPEEFPVARWLQLARTHHERFDGNGYPFGLKGEEIPIEGRIVAVADAWDSMISPRVYRPNMSEEQALQILKTHYGSQWDPKVVEAFFKAYNAEEIQAVLSDAREHDS